MGSMARRRPPTPRWRDFELLAARLEEWLGPKGATVKSPDRVPDRSTGKLTEVDATIRCQIGSTPVLITVECRNWKRPQGKQWIEQLATKQADIGAAITIAVSSSGFSSHAVKKAEKHAILLRRVDDISESDAVAWMNDVKIMLTFLSWDLRSITLQRDHRGRREVPLEPALLEAFQKNPYDTELIFEKQSGQTATARQLVQQAMAQPEVGALKDVEPDGPNVNKVLTFGFPAGKFFTKSDEGPIDIKWVDVAINIRLVRKLAPPFRALQYAESDGSPKLVIGESTLQHAGHVITLHISNVPPADDPDST